jgi:uncharacterized protein (TIRG00374 family)
MERIFDLLTIVALLGFVFAGGQRVPQLLINAGYAISAVAIVGFLFAGLLAVRGPDVIERLDRLLGWVPDKLRSGIRQQLQNIARGFESIKHPAALLRITVNSAIQWFVMGLCIYCSLIALNIDIPVSGVALVLLATVIGISLPTGPGYVGNIQLAFTLALQPFGIDPAQALAASIFYHVLAYAAVVLVGFSLLHKMGYGVRQLAENARDSATE